MSARQSPAGVCLQVACASVLALVLGTPRTASAAGPQMFTATLSAGQQVLPPITSPGTGLGTVLLNAAEDQITVNLSFSGLTTPAILGHIHGPGAAGTNAGVLF